MTSFSVSVARALLSSEAWVVATVFCPLRTCQTRIAATNASASTGRSSVWVRMRLNWVRFTEFPRPVLPLRLLKSGFKLKQALEFLQQRRRAFTLGHVDVHEIGNFGWQTHVRGQQE